MPRHSEPQNATVADNLRAVSFGKWTQKFRLMTCCPDALRASPQLLDISVKSTGRLLELDRRVVKPRPEPREVAATHVELETR